MSRQLTLICHLERLGPVYHPGYVDFWLGLIAGFEDVTNITPAEEQLLQSWLWSINGIHVAGIATAVPPALLPVANVVPLRLPANFFIDTTDFTTCLKDHFKRAVKNGGFALTSSPTVDRDALPWTAFLSSASTWPGGLADHMNLALRFRIKSTDLTAFTELVAAPAFDTTKPFALACGPLDPNIANAFQTKIVGTDKRYEWSFSPTDATANPDVVVVARQAPCTIALAPLVGDDTIDIATLLPKDFELGGGASDWTEDLELNLAAFFDLPQLLLGVLRNRLKNGQPLFSSGPHQLFIASLRDIANLGLSEAPDGTILAEDLLNAATLLDSLQPLQDSDKLNTYASWSNTLFQAIKSVYKQAPGTPLLNIDDINGLGVQEAQDDAATLAAKDSKSYLARARSSALPGRPGRYPLHPHRNFLDYDLRA